MPIEKLTQKQKHTIHYLHLYLIICMKDFLALKKTGKAAEEIEKNINYRDDYYFFFYFSPRCSVWVSAVLGSVGSWFLHGGARTCRVSAVLGSGVASRLAVLERSGWKWVYGLAMLDVGWARDFRSMAGKPQCLEWDLKQPQVQPRSG